MGVMASLADRRGGASPLPRQVNWRGRSGRFYALTAEKLETFALSTDDLYMLARGTIPMWVGSAADVQKGMQFNIVDRQNGTFLGILTVDNVEQNEAAGPLKGPHVDQIKQGNEARTQL